MSPPLMKQVNHQAKEVCKHYVMDGRYDQLKNYGTASQYKAQAIPTLSTKQERATCGLYPMGYCWHLKMTNASQVR
jgi:hypothetical protein